MVNGESLFSYKARTAKTDPKPRRSNAAVNTQNKDRAKGPKPLTKAEQWLKDNPPNRQGIVDEVKSMLSPGNLTGANAITAAIKGEGMSTTQRITSGLSGVVQGLSFAAGGKAGKVGVEGVSSAIKTGKIVNPKALMENIKSGERVILHASPVKGLKELSPNLGSKAMSKENVLFGWNPRIPGSGESAIGNAIPYSRAKKSEIIEPGSIYVAKVPKKSTSASVPKKIKNSSKMVVSTKPGKVVAEIPLDQSRPNVFATVQQEMRKAGVVPFKTPNPISNALYKVDDALDFVIEKSKKIQKKLPKKR